ncbi:DUF3265 domain-containing protein [Vibrio harveyi]|nr:DUF3265 domain-containing protein [Vibrio vulnificus]MDL2044677.1 DUF3265 domain-containing protein [Vibrio parahaemolyticus]
MVCGGIGIACLTP